MRELEKSLTAIGQEVEWLPQRFERMAERLQQVFDQAAGQAPMFLEFWSQVTKDPTAWRDSIEPYQRFCSIFTRWIEGRRNPAEQLEGCRCGYGGGNAGIPWSWSDLAGSYGTKRRGPGNYPSDSGEIVFRRNVLSANAGW